MAQSNGPSSMPARKHRWIALTLTAAMLPALLGGCAATHAGPATAATARPCDALSVTSRPGKAWWVQQRWRYASDAEATAAYQTIVTGQSPWPNWFVVTQSTLAPGTRFQMAVAPGQTDTQPGAFGTFDNVFTVEDVRKYLAVLVQWKPVIDRVITYEVIKPLPVEIGPIGPQVDPILCELLPGRWSQFEMQVPSSDRMSYLKVLGVRPLPALIAIGAPPAPACGAPIALATPPRPR